MIAIVDYDIGNLAAVSNMLRRAGALSEITSDPSLIEQATGIVLPGNGAFDACMRGLRASGLVPLLERKVLNEWTPLLGICVGAQMLGQSSDEGDEPGLGWLQLRVRRLPDLPGLRIPHMGWNDVRISRPDHPLSGGIGNDSRFYFVHSYCLHAQDERDVFMWTHYGIDFAAGISHANIYGVQFHPEKSHRFGKQLLGNFAKLTKCTEAV